MKPKTRKRWTPYEDSVLRSYVKKYPENLHYCFFLVGKELDRSLTAVEMRWYQKLKKQTVRKGTVFMLFSKFKKFINSKNQRKDYGK